LKESELKSLREAYDATQAALRVERQMAAETATKSEMMSEECSTLRQRLTHLSTMQDISHINMTGEWSMERERKDRTSKSMSSLSSKRMFKSLSGKLSLSLSPALPLTLSDT
jgi:hypothetical protein